MRTEGCDRVSPFSEVTFKTGDSPTECVRAVAALPGFDLSHEVAVTLCRLQKEDAGFAYAGDWAT
jgi:hypothetical protein